MEFPDRWNKKWKSHKEIISIPAVRHTHEKNRWNKGIAVIYKRLKINKNGWTLQEFLFIRKPWTINNLTPENFETWPPTDISHLKIKRPCVSTHSLLIYLFFFMFFILLFLIFCNVAFLIIHVLSYYFLSLFRLSLVVFTLVYFLGRKLRQSWHRKQVFPTLIVNQKRHSTQTNPAQEKALRYPDIKTGKTFCRDEIFLDKSFLTQTFREDILPRQNRNRQQILPYQDFQIRKTFYLVKFGTNNKSFFTQILTQEKLSVHSKLSQAINLSLPRFSNRKDILPRQSCHRQYFFVTQTFRH